MTESITAVPTLTKPAALATVLPSNLPLPAYPQTQITQIPDADSGNPYAKLKIGDRVWLGSYEQDNNFFNGTESIEWTVIQVQDGTALLLSRLLPVYIAAAYLHALPDVHEYGSLPEIYHTVGTVAANGGKRHTVHIACFRRFIVVPIPVRIYPYKADAPCVFIMLCRCLYTSG